jgi:hypothetical protein
LESIKPVYKILLIKKINQSLLKFTAMKQKLFFGVAVVLLSSLMSWTYKPDLKFISPYFEYSFAAVSTDGTPDINLEKSSAIYQAPKSKTATPALNIDGAKSVVRLKPGMDFLAHHIVDGTTATLTDMIGLYKLNADKKNRSLTLDATGIISATKVTITLAQTDAETIRILMAGVVLSPGEYAFVEKNMAAANSKLAVWCFGID